MTYAQRIKHRKSKPEFYLLVGCIYTTLWNILPTLSWIHDCISISKYVIRPSFTCIPATALSCNLLWPTKLSRVTLAPRWQLFLKVFLNMMPQDHVCWLPWDPTLQTQSLDENISSTSLPRTSSKYADGTEFLFLGPLFASIVCKDLRSAY